MDFSQSFDTCCSKYKILEGRASRSEFWWFQLGLALHLAIGLLILYFVVNSSAFSDGGFWVRAFLGGVLVLVGLWLLVTLGFFIPWFSALIRRLHDIGRSGWSVFVWFLLLMAGALSVGDSYVEHPPFPLNLLIPVVPLLPLIAVVGTIVIIIQLMLKGDVGENKYGAPPQHYGIPNETPDDILRTLVRVEVNPKLYEGGNTALIWAAREGHTEIAQLLIQAEVNPNAADQDGLTALMWAVEKGHTEIVQLLRDAGARE